MATLKVCMVTNLFYPRGYGGTAVFELCRHLVKQGVEIHVITSSVKGCLSEETIEGIQIHRITTHFQKIFNSEYPISPTALNEIFSIIRTNKIDIIHTHFIFSPFALNTGFLKSIGVLSAPLIVTSHGVTQGYPTFLTNVAAKMLCSISKKVVISKAKAVVTVSKSEYYYLLKDLPQGLYNIPNGVDTDRFKPSPEKRKMLRNQLGIKEDMILVLYFAHLREAKGILTLLESIDSVLDRCPNVAFLIAGSGPLKDQVAKMVSRSSGRVHSILNYIPDESLPFLYNACDVYVLPSFVEGMPLSVMEAMACGKPVIATNVSDVPVLVEDTTNGLIISPGNTHELIESIIRLASNSGLRALMSGLNVNKMKNYGWAEIARRYIILYWKILDTAENTRAPSESSSIIHET